MPENRSYFSCAAQRSAELGSVAVAGCVFLVQRSAVLGSVAVTVRRSYFLAQRSEELGSVAVAVAFRTFLARRGAELGSAAVRARVDSLRVGAQNEKARGESGPEKAMLVVRDQNVGRQELRCGHPRAPRA